MTLDLTSFDAALKEFYTNDMIENLVYKDNPLLALLPKMEQFGGRNLPIPIIHGNPQGRSKTFSNAQARSTLSESQIKQFTLLRSRDYSLATIDNETLEASKGNDAAFMEAATTEIDGAIQSLTRSLAVGLYRGADASIGQLVAEPAETAGTFVIILKDIEEITNFEIGQVLVVFSAKSGGTQRNSDGTDVNFVISKVNRSNGQITVVGTYDASGTIAADDFIFVEGDRGNGIAGLEDWLPSAAPGSTAFFGVDRSVDTTRLGGNRFDGSALPIEEALIEGANVAGREGGRITHYFMNFAKYSELVKALGSKVQIIDLRATPQIGFQAIQVAGAKGVINVVPDHNCPSDRAYGLQMDKWKFYSLGKAVRVIDTDGLQMLRQSNADGVEVRYGFYGNLATRAPGFSVNVQL